MLNYLNIFENPASAVLIFDYYNDNSFNDTTYLFIIGFINSRNIKNPHPPPLNVFLFLFVVVVFFKTH